MAQIYGQLRVFYNGTAAEEITSVSFRTETGIVPVETMFKGLSGFSIGSGRVTVELGFNIPATGSEFDFQEDAANHAEVVLQISYGGKSYAADGMIESIDISQSSGETLTGTLTWIGPLKPIK